MTLEQRSQAAYGFAALVTALAYFIWLFSQLTHTAADDIEFVVPLLWTLGASMLIHALGNGFVRGARRPQEASRDERDTEIRIRGDALTFYVFSALAAVPLVLGMLQLDAFWITNSLFAAFALAAVFGVVVKSVLYARGLS